MKGRILVVDDEEAIRKSLQRILKYEGYDPVCVSSPEEALKVAQGLGGGVVVKAQVHAGGRGKGGGIKLADSPQQAAEIAGKLLGGRLVTPQTSAEGVPVHRFVVDEKGGEQGLLGLDVVGQALEGFRLIAARGKRAHVGSGRFHLRRS